MSSYKPVIYIFGAVGLLGIIALSGSAIHALRSFSSSDYTYDALNGEFASSTDTYGFPDPYGNSFSTSSMMLDDEASYTNNPVVPSEISNEAGTDAYLGTNIAYASLKDKTVMNELKLRDDIDPAFKALLSRPDTSFQEMYRSNAKLVLKMTALDEQLQTILVQDLKDGSLFDTKIDAHGNYLLAGSQIVYLTPGTTGSAQSEELVQASSYNIEANQTKREAVLVTGSSYTKILEPSGRPVANLKLTNGKAEVNIYSSKDAARFDKERTSLRTVSYPSSR